MMLYLYLQARRSVFSLAILLTCIISINAQPSGGPYGPVKQNYELPKVTGKIYYVAPDGNAGAQGDQLTAPTTIESAVAKARSGDAIILRGGIYRTGDLKFNQGITFQPYASEQPVIKGTLEAKDWKSIGKNVWKTSWENFFPDKPDGWWSRDRYGKTTPLHLFNNDMVFIDGRLLKSAAWEGDVNETSFYIDYPSKSIYIGIDPKDHLVEITAFNRGLHRVITDLNGVPSDKKGFNLRGIILTQYAYCTLEIDGAEPQRIADPSEFGKDVPGSLIENCTFSYCGRVGAYLRGDNTVLRNCDVHHTTTEGIYLLCSSDCLLEKNRFSQNNIENIDGYYPAAVKIFNQTHRTTCKDNLVYDLPLSNGIWYDVGNIDGRFINNWVTGVGTNKGKRPDYSIMWPNYNGFFFEISKGAICAGNVFDDCDQAVFVLNSRDVQIYNNTFVNSTVCIRRDKRSAANDHFGWHPSSGPDIDERYGHTFVNNLLVGDENFRVPFISVSQHQDLCATLKDSQLKQMDYNVIVRDPEANYKILANWGPTKTLNSNNNCDESIETIDGLNKVLDMSSAHNQFFSDLNLQAFQSRELGNYQLLPGFAGSKSATVLPVDIQKLLGLTARYTPYTGAYPVK
ncbi:MAG TPA: right-handed parallel beta-helix repeat-containing protein [Bacteroidales bacterium]|jgi:parallel beta-helix repeat protein|nr:right-handed parallel beta-helix repeat-containing protein [Bacteroidales bacterium]